jgi:Spy/CpxP family protein refolding chaperone
MQSIMLALLVTVTAAAVVTPATAEAPTGPLEEAGRLIDQLAGRLGSVGAELAEQVRQGRDRMGSGGGLMGRMPGEPAARPLITIMLHHRSELGLSPEQVSRLEELRAEFNREAIRRDADIRIVELDLAKLLEQEAPDLAKVEAKVREAAQLRADLRIARLRAVEQGKAVLMPEQRTRLQTMLSSGMHHGPAGAPAPRRSAETAPHL